MPLDDHVLCLCRVTHLGLAVNLTVNTSSSRAGVQLDEGLLSAPPLPAAVPPSAVEPSATFQTTSSARDTCVRSRKWWDTLPGCGESGRIVLV